MIVVVIGDGVLAFTVLGFNEQDSSGELAIRPWAVLGGDGRCCGSRYRLVCIDADNLLAFGDQPFVRVQVVAAPSLLR